MCRVVGPDWDIEAGDQSSDPDEWIANNAIDAEVTSATRRDQKLLETAAAVFVITPEDIRRSGLNCIPELAGSPQSVREGLLPDPDSSIRSIENRIHN